MWHKLLLITSFGCNGRILPIRLWFDNNIVKWQRGFLQHGVCSSGCPHPSVPHPIITYCTRLKSGNILGGQNGLVPVIRWQKMGLEPPPIMSRRRRDCAVRPSATTPRSRCGDAAWYTISICENANRHFQYRSRAAFVVARMNSGFGPCAASRSSVALERRMTSVFSTVAAAPAGCRFYSSVSSDKCGDSSPFCRPRANEQRRRMRSGVAGILFQLGNVRGGYRGWVSGVTSHPVLPERETVHGIKPFHAPWRTFTVFCKAIIVPLKDMVTTCFVLLASMCLLYTYNMFYNSKFI